MLRTQSIRSPLIPLVALAVAASSAAACNREEVVPPPPIEGGIVIAATPPPAISGGTLVVTRDGTRAVAADPDRDRVWVVNLDSGAVEQSIALSPGDEPGRLVEDGAGRVHVALRRGGAVVAIDPQSGAILRSASVCREPRGVAHDQATDRIHVACAGGALVTLDAGSYAEIGRLALDADLRDVVVDGGSLLVSRFRSAELLVVGADGSVASRLAPATASIEGFNLDGTTRMDVFEPGVAYRTLALPGGGALMIHQRATSTPVPTDIPGGYGMGECGSVVHGTISLFRAPEGGTIAAPAAGAMPLAGALPVDVAVSPNGLQIAAAMAGSGQVMVLDPSALDIPAQPESCMFGEFVEGTPIAVAFRDSSVLVQTRQPPAIVTLGGARIELPGEDVTDTGHQMFHATPEFGSLACASCHPEGREDGRVWTFEPLGVRRTQSLGGGLLGTLPLHWGGDMSDFNAIMDEVFVGRMGGMDPGPRRARVLARWIDELPAPAPARDAADPAAVRGKAIFESDAVGCATCHSGAMLTNNKNEDVGTGEALQTPTLVGVSARAPFMHDGCAATLRDRFDPACGGASHGSIEGLDAQAIDDLVAYLESL